MKVLFVYPNISRARTPQLGLCMIAAVARNLGHECALYDLTTIPEGEEIAAFESQVASFGPDLVAVSVRSNEWSFVERLFQSVNVGDAIRVIGGPHATVAPDECINIFDIVVRGEGETTFGEILQRTAAQDDFSDIDGCWVTQGTRIVKNEMRDLISNLDQLPLPYWRLFANIHYHESYIKAYATWATVIGSFETSRGCPYACSYCTNPYSRKLYKGKGKWRREKSPERIVEEIQAFRDERGGLDFVLFVDEIVLTDIDRLKKFSVLYRTEISVPFCFMERPENMTDEKVRLIKQAGAQRVSIGIESGDEQVRKTTLNRHHSQETIISAFKTARKHGIDTYAFTMVGFPGESRQSIIETYKVLKEARPDTIQTTTFFPLKGSKLFDKVVADGLFDPQTPMPKSYYGTSALRLDKSEQRELSRRQYLLIDYKNPLMRFFVYTKLNPLFYRVFIWPYIACTMFKKQGFTSALKGICKRITRG